MRRCVPLYKYYKVFKKTGSRAWGLDIYSHRSTSRDYGIQFTVPARPPLSVMSIFKPVPSAFMTNMIAQHLVGLFSA